MFKCNDCKDTGKIQLLYSYVDCDCSNKLQTVLDNKCEPNHFSRYTFYARSIILQPNEFGTLTLVANNCKPVNVYLLSISVTNVCKELPVEIKSIRIGNSEQSLPRDFNICRILSRVDWDKITEYSSLRIKFRNPNNENIFVSLGLWGE